MTPEEAKRLDHFFCESCSSESQKKLQNSHNASRNSDTKVRLSYQMKLSKPVVVTVDPLLLSYLVDIDTILGNEL